MAASSYFVKLFSESTEREVKIEQCNGHALDKLINHCYTGSFNISEENVHTLLETAELFEFLAARELCLDFMRSKGIAPKRTSESRKISDADLVAVGPSLDGQGKICVECYIGDTNEWLWVNTLRELRWHFQSCLFQRKLILAGGQVSSTNRLDSVRIELREDSISSYLMIHLQDA